MSKLSLNDCAYRPEIDGLRAFAVLSVVAFHAFPTLLKGGFIGVDIFFVISGFLITGHIFEKLGRNQFSLAEFFGRRIRRIFPALILVMACSLAFGWLVLLADEYSQLGKHISSGAAFVINLILLDESGYFDNAASTKPMLHLWSLAVEEQFYIIWPLVLWVAWKQRLNLLISTIIIAGISFYLNLRFVEAYPTEAFFLPIGRFWELLSGSVLAWMLLYKAEFLSEFKLKIDRYFTRCFFSGTVGGDGSTFTNLMSLFGLLLLVGSVIFIDERLVFPSQWTLIPVAGALLIIASGSKAWPNRLLLMNPFAIWIGLISYPLYLWHWPLLSFLQIIEGEFPRREMRIAAVLLSIVLAWFTYRFVENPIRGAGQWRAKTISLLLLMASVGVLAALVHSSDGRIFSNSPKQMVADTALASPKRKDCHFPRKNDFESRPVCSYFGRNQSVAVFGNSHSVELAYGLAEELRGGDVGIVHHTMSGCNHNFGLSNIVESQQICALWEAGIVEKLKLDKSVATVVVSYRNEAYLKEVPARKALATMLNTLSRANKEVILVLQAPMPRMHINSYIRKYVFSSRASIKGRTRDDWNEIYSAKNDLLKELSNDIKVYDPSDIFCDTQDCYVIKDGNALFFDDDHMSLEGAAMVAKAVVKLIESPLM